MPSKKSTSKTDQKPIKPSSRAKQKPIKSSSKTITKARPRPARRNKTSYQTNIPYFHLEGISDNMGSWMFAIVVTNNGEIDDLDEIVSNIMGDEYKFYTTWNDQDIYLDYLIYVKPMWRAGDKLQAWAEEVLKKDVAKRVARLQDDFKRSPISSVDE